MKTLFILMSCCHYRRPINSANWQPVVDAIPCICWGIIMLIALYLILKLIVLPLIKNCHEMKMKDEAFTQEKYWYDEKKKASDEDLNRKIREHNEITQKSSEEDLNRKIREYNELTKVSNDEDLARKIREYNELTKVSNDEDLARKIREYNELTIHQKVLGKVTGSDEEIETLKKNLEDLKKKYESLDGEIEQIIIKKKQ